MASLVGTAFNRADARFDGPCTSDFRSAEQRLDSTPENQDQSRSQQTDVKPTFQKETPPQVGPEGNTPNQPSLGDLTNALFALVNQMGRNNNAITKNSLERTEYRPSSTLRVTFSGLEHEDPHKFLEKLANWFARNHIHDDEEKLSLAMDQLKGAAAQWIRPQRAFPMKYSEFCDRLLRKYQNPDLEAELTASLYGQRQGPDEPSETFLLKKRALHQRLVGPDSDDLFIRLATTLLRPELRSRVRGQYWTDALDFMTRVQLLEDDIKEERKSLKAVMASKPNPPAVGYNSNRYPAGNQGNRQVSTQFNRPAGPQNPGGQNQSNPAPPRQENKFPREEGNRRPSNANWRSNERQGDNTQKMCQFCKQRHQPGRCRAIEAAPVTSAPKTEPTQTQQSGNSLEAA